MNYTQNITYLTQYAGDGGYASDPDFTAQLPVFIQSGELRVLRDLDLLNTRVTDSSAALALNTREFVLPTDVGTFQVVETVSIQMTYAGTINPADGPLLTQAPLLWVSKEYLDAVYPGEAAIGNPSIPTYVAPISDTVYAVGPAPSAAFPLVIYGMQWPASLATMSGTESTFISTNLPDLLLASEMIDVMMWERQFGLKADEAQGAVDWATEYEKLKAQADVMELRRKIQGTGWGIRAPDPVAKAA